MSQSRYTARASPASRLPQRSPLWLMKHPARPTAGRLMSQYGYTAPASPANRLPQQSPLWLMKHPARPTAAHIIFRYERSPQPHVAPSTLRRARLSEEPWTAHSQKAILQTTRPSATTTVAAYPALQSVLIQDNPDVWRNPPSRRRETIHPQRSA